VCVFYLHLDVHDGLQNINTNTFCIKNFIKLCKFVIKIKFLLCTNCIFCPLQFYAGFSALSIHLKFWPRIEILIKKSKTWLKIKILTKIEILTKNRNFGQKSKSRPKISIFLSFCFDLRISKRKDSDFKKYNFLEYDKKKCHLFFLFPSFRYDSVANPRNTPFTFFSNNTVDFTIFISF